MGITWSKILSTGLPWQDAQHIELFNRVGALLDAINKGQGAEEVEGLFTFLDEYFVFHFAAEEEAMHGANYPDTTKHMTEHHKFIDDVARLRREGISGSPAAELIKKMEGAMVDWLVNHIGGMDKEVGGFLIKFEHTKKVEQG